MLSLVYRWNQASIVWNIVKYKYNGKYIDEA